MAYPVVRILPGHDRRLRAGSPWLFSNELQMDKAKQLEPGSVVRLASQDGRAMALALFNPHSLIAARILTRSTDAVVDRAFIDRRLARALALRDTLFAVPCYRLVNAEADGLPGVVIDRYGDILVLQVNSAGMARLEAELVAALVGRFAPRAVVLRNDSPVRTLEGLASEVRLAHGALDGPVELAENGLRFRADPMTGQKTGWYYDQRDNRAFAARLAPAREVLDLYGYSGGFGLAAAAAGAASVLIIDRAADALALAADGAALNGLAATVTTDREEAFAALDRLSTEKRRFGLVTADPPPFARSKRDVPAALKGYQKLARLAAAVVGEAGFLCLSSCSHNVAEETFLEASYAGIRAAGRGARLIRQAGAGPDHPVHPGLPESDYLKFLAFALD
jgi:23S rRNA (cytosine1962-C5)-methyltransferase